MGDLQAQPNGNLTEEKENASSSNPHPATIGENIWARAEERIAEIILFLQPTLRSEKKRREVIEYVQRLVRERLGCDVFPFGSVPLKTYLPDGDIDLTTFSNLPNTDDKWANYVRSILVGEESSNTAEYTVREVQYIDAEVKLVKCLVENIVVDVSFNQLGGLCTLCFLEKVDRLIGKDHLFKRSIILVKAWCYYESRILGAHHSLISTYALETLVLYIFHLFHASLHGPLEVLYRFLDYFSKFEWETYCVSIQGRVPIAALPDIVAEPPETDGGELLLNEEFVKSCTELFYVPPRGHDNHSRAWTSKHLNIIDPLRENNNLGRSVSQGNFYRIRSAFSYGARKLGKIILSSEEKVAEELDKFFLNTLDRHGKGQRPDVPDSVGCSLQCRMLGKSRSFTPSSGSYFDDNKHANNPSCERHEHSHELSESDRIQNVSDAYQDNMCSEIKNRRTLMDSRSKLVSDVVYSPRHSVRNKPGQNITNCFSNELSKSSPGSNYELPTEETLVHGNCMTREAKALVNNHLHDDHFGTKSSDILPEYEITKPCNCNRSRHANRKSISESVSSDSISCRYCCQGHLGSNTTNNRVSQEASVSSHIYCSRSCDNYDCQCATYIEKVSIDKSVFVKKESMDAKPRYMMPNLRKRDLSSHVHDSISFVPSNESALLQPSGLAGKSVPYSLMPVDHPQSLDLHWNSGSILPDSAMHSHMVSQDSTLHRPGLGNNFNDDRYLEKSKVQDTYPEPKLRTNLSSTSSDNCEQAVDGEESLKWSSKVDEDGCSNIISKVQNDAFSMGHISCLDQRGVEHPEHLCLFPKDNVDISSKNSPQDSAAQSHYSGFDRPVKSDYSYPAQVDDRVASLEEVLSAPDSFHMNLSDISRAADGTNFKNGDALFYADKSMDGTQPNTKSGDLFIEREPEESLKDCQGRSSISCGGRVKEKQRRTVLDALMYLKSDLTADFDSHLKNLNIGKWCQEAVHDSILPYPMVSPFIQDPYALPDGIVRPLHANANILPCMQGSYRVVPFPSFLHASGYRGPNSGMPGNFSVEELPKPRSGTGTYFPNLNLRSNKERHINRSRNQGPPAHGFTPRMNSQLHRSRSNGRNKTSDQNFQRQQGYKNNDINSLGVRSSDREGDISNSWRASYPSTSNTELDPTTGLVGTEVSSTNGHGNVSFSPKIKTSSSSVSLMHPYCNGSDFSELEFGTYGPVQLDGISHQVSSSSSRHLDSDQMNGKLFTSGTEIEYASRGRNQQKQDGLLNHGREESCSSLLKEDDFPPLSFHRQYGRSSTNGGSNNNSNNRGSHRQTSVKTS